MNIERQIGIKTIIILTLGLWLGAAMAEPFVELTNGQRRTGVEIRRMASGDVMLITEDGNRFTFTEDQVRRAVAARPQDFDRAAQALRAGRYDLAERALEQIVSDYQGLEWDVRAMPMLAEAYTAQDKHREAVTALERLFRRNPEAEKDPGISVAYANALLKTNQMSKLQEQIQKMISRGERESAAFAQLIRGNIEMERGNYKAAAKDYLRTVYFFQNAESVMPEATFRLAESLEKMRDSRAKEWYEEVVSNFPGTEFAAKARDKL